MDQINNENQNAVSILADTILQAVKNGTDLNFDTTFPTVVEGFCPQKKTYKIRDHSGAYRNIRCALPNVTLSTGKQVWVKIPSGNINEMHICGIR